METLKGKQVLVVGATGTIGAAIVKLLVGSGALVAITGRNKSKLDELARANGISLNRTVEMDLASSASIIAAMTTLKQEMPVVDILVNAAGVGIIKPLELLSESDLLQSLQVNLIGVFHLVQAVLPGMKEQKKGLIINIPGILGKVPMAGAAAYSASKYGLVGMMQSIREELKRTEIRITNLFLGGVDSAFWDHIDLRVQRDKMVVAEEAAKAVWFLCQQPRSGVVSEMVLQPFNHQAI
jgi:NADP-dependent 3-hydroxy acid dehydrogenase YdfG